MRPGEESARREAYAIVAADPRADREAILRLWRSGLTQNDRPEAKFDWYYLRNPEGAPLVFLLRSVSAQECVGVASVGPLRMRRGAQPLAGGALVDLVVLPEHRGFFPALFLQKEMRREALARHALIYGMPNPKSEAVVRRAGYQRVGEVVRRVRVLRSATYLSRYVPRVLATAAAAVVDRARMAWAIRSLRAGPYSLRPAAGPDARFDALWESAAMPGVTTGVRDARFLAWRFVDCPFGPFEFFTLETEGSAAIAGYAVVQARGETLHVLDFLVDPAHASAGRVLWMGLARLAWNRGMASLSVVFLGPGQVAAGMEAAGLVAREQRWLYAAASDERALEGAGWYFTAADEDA